MADSKRWSSLSGRTRRALIIGASAEATLKGAALLDLRRRPASEIRGPKWAWVVTLFLVSSFGILPVSYFAFGRRR